LSAFKLPGAPATQPLAASRIAQTQRLRIEPLREAHAALMLPVLQDERIYRYIPSRRYTRLDELAERYRRLASGSPEPDECWWNGCLFRREDGAAIGNLQATLVPAERVVWVAYVLTPTAWGRGYASEALAWLLDQLAIDPGLDVARAQIDVRHTASQRVVERLGFARVSEVEEGGRLDAIYEKLLLRGCG
jgi:[ribosomal protein S5]-alanine N-acetyltransferase